DGVGVVVFITLVSIAQGTAAEGDLIGAVAYTFSIEVFGGVLLGLLLGWICYRLMRRINDYEIEVMITLACVMGGYAGAQLLHVSGPLAMVTAGLLLGNSGVRQASMSERTEELVDKFWHLVDVLLNALLFVLIGLELLVVDFGATELLAGLLAVVLVLFARYTSLLLPVRLFAKKLDFPKHTTAIMTWGGLRGGLSIALALGLPASPDRDLLIAVTYVVVVFSILVQGLTLGRLTNRLLGRKSAAPRSAAS
ncbi:MAG: cation:proton antiporter, partial [Flavobacteriales bacterium]|nr:cation:proton antiporter [Flavobacteriales bacterium]